MQSLSDDSLKVRRCLPDNQQQGRNLRLPANCLGKLTQVSVIFFFFFVNLNSDIYYIYRYIYVDQSMET